MTKTQIITDSSCDLSADVIAELGIAVIPLEVRFGDEAFRDGVDLSTTEFWERARAASDLPTTAAAAPGAFVEAYQAAAQAGATDAVVIVLSGDLSATLEAANQAAAEAPDGLAVHIVDSRSVSAGLGLVVVDAAEQAHAGADGAQVAAAAQAMAERVHVYAALDTLENLRKGGRIGAAQSLLGSVLSIKPIITVADGKVGEHGKQRTRARATAHLIDLVAQHKDSIERLAVVHADCDDVGAFVERLRPHLAADPMVCMIGPVVGAHAGAGTIGVVFVEAAAQA